MSTTQATRLARVRERAEAAGQGHLFEDLERLTAGQTRSLLEELEELDFELVGRLAGELRARGTPRAPARIEPPDLFPLERDGALEQQAIEARRVGEARLREGRVGYLLVAGGQASRLGYDGPKGAFAIGPVSGASLFQIHAHRLRAAALRYGCRTPWYVMTSRANDEPTRAFFERHAYFGLAREDVHFFSQAMMPALDFEGRILRSGPGRLFLAPNGHGGVLAALADSGLLEDARNRGLTQLSYFQVDNPLARPADPLFLGLHDAGGAGMSSKVVSKRDAGEKVGVLGRVDGRMSCIEYSDLPDELRQARDPQGGLRFRAGNIAIHVLKREFVEQLVHGGLQLPWHIARKTMQVWQGGRLVDCQGAKFETFVFDALQRSEPSVTLEVARAHEFSPVKNAEGQDSPASTREDLCRLHASWVRAAGLALPTSEDPPSVEVDPLLAEDEESFVAGAPHRPQILEHGHLYR